MSPELSYVRLSKLLELRSPSGHEQGKAILGYTNNGGASGHYIREGYVIDGWFLMPPAVGGRMVMLRFRRNGVERLGVFSSSRVTFVGEAEIHTENSIYGIEHRSFEEYLRYEG